MVNIEEVMPIVSKLAQKYCGYESTSVTYERAQSLMEAVLYCIEEYRSATKQDTSRSEEKRSQMKELQETTCTLEEQYTAGARLVIEKAKRVREIHNELTDYFDDYGVRCLYDTVQKGIPEFLKWYDPEFGPQETILTLDYPLLYTDTSLCGVDAVYRYLLAVRTEQRFLKAFDRGYLMLLLQKYQPQYRSMVENICDIVLTNMIGHVVLGKPLDDVGFQKEEYRELQKVLANKSVDELTKDNICMIRRICRHLYQGSICHRKEKESMESQEEEMVQYLCLDAENIAVRMENAVLNGHLNRIFLM